MSRDKIRRVYEIECQLCHHIDQPPGSNVQQVEKAARDEGWRYSHGWICPRCVREEAE